MALISMLTIPRKKLITAAKTVFGLSLLALLICWGDNPARLLDLATSIDGLDILWLCIISLALNWISSLKWGLFLKERGYRISPLRLLGLYFVGKFFSNFIPTTIGGDITRTYLLGRQINSQSQSLASVFLERATGFAALIMLALIFATFNPRLLFEPKIGIALAAVAIGFAAALTVILSRRWVRFLETHWGRVSAVNTLLAQLSKVQNEILYFKGRSRLLIKAMAYSFAFHLMTVVNVYIACAAIGLYPAFLDLAVVTPIILLLNVLPVSPNNIGWWEWTFSFLLVEAGAGSAEGLAVGLILRAITLLSSLAGGVVFLFERDYTRHREQAPL